MEHTEQSDADYLRGAIANGQAHEIMAMIREMDSVCAALGIQESFETPTEAIRKLLAKLPVD